MWVASRRMAGVAAFLLALVSCGEQAQLFSSLDEPEPVSLATVEPGAIVGSADQLEISVTYPGEDATRATSMRVQLLYPDGRVAGEVAYTREQLAEPQLPPVQLPEPDPGVYVLLVEALVNDQILVSDRRQVFVLDDRPEIQRLSIRPTSIGPQMQALARVELSSPPPTRPYLRWLFNDSVVAEGYLADGLDRVVLTPDPDGQGAFQVDLEVYPWGPEEGASIDGSTEIGGSAELLVRAGVSPLPPDARGDRPGRVLRYYSFDGTTLAWEDPQASGESDAARANGDAVLDLAGGALGFRVMPGAELAVPIVEDQELVRRRFGIDGLLVEATLMTSGEQELRWLIPLHEAGADSTTEPGTQAPQQLPPRGGFGRDAAPADVAPSPVLLEQAEGAFQLRLTPADEQGVLVDRVRVVGLTAEERRLVLARAWSDELRRVAAVDAGADELSLVAAPHDDADLVDRLGWRVAPDELVWNLELAPLLATLLMPEGTALSMDFDTQQLELVRIAGSWVLRDRRSGLERSIEAGDDPLIRLELLPRDSGAARIAVEEGRVELALPAADIRLRATAESAEIPLLLLIDR